MLYTGAIGTRSTYTFYRIAVMWTINSVTTRLVTTVVVASQKTKLQSLCWACYTSSIHVIWPWKIRDTYVTAGICSFTENNMDLSKTMDVCCIANLSSWLPFLYLCLLLCLIVYSSSQYLTFLVSSKNTSQNMQISNCTYIKPISHIFISHYFSRSPLIMTNTFVTVSQFFKK